MQVLAAVFVVDFRDYPSAIDTNTITEFHGEAEPLVALPLHFQILLRE